MSIAPYGFDVYLIGIFRERLCAVGSVVLSEPPVLSSTRGPLPWLIVSSVPWVFVGSVAVCVGAEVGAVVISVVGSIVVGVVIPAFRLVQPQPVSIAAVRTKLINNDANDFISFPPKIWFHT